MSDGVLYKSNGTTWSKSVCKKGNGSVMSNGIVKHSNGTSWFRNYPMEQLYESYFNVVWTHGYKADGTILDTATWGYHPRAGDTVDFVGMWGFDNAALKSFVSTGVVQDIQIQVMFDDPGHAGNPVVNFFPHVYTGTAYPGSYNGNYANTNYTKQETFTQTGADFTRWVKLPVGAWLNGSLGGVVCRAAAATAANSCRFAGDTTGFGMNAFNTQLWIQVLK